MQTAAFYKAWINDLTKRNHTMVERCFAKILHNNPKINPKVVLAWAVTAKEQLPGPRWLQQLPAGVREAAQALQRHGGQAASP